jgi:hypothetical protein
MAQDAISIADHLVSDDAKASIGVLQKQLNQYRMITSQPNGLGSKPRMSYSGKFGPDGKLNNLQDDLCIALQMAAYWSSYVIQRKCKFFDYSEFN